jgi:hypothetical protein
MKILNLSELKESETSSPEKPIESNAGKKITVGKAVRRQTSIKQTIKSARNPFINKIVVY